jgi:hypothetical protein
VDLYVRQKHNVVETAAILKVSTEYVSKRLHEAGLTKRPGTFTPHGPWDPAELRERASDLYEDGMTMRSVGLELGVSVGTVRVALHQSGVQVRRGGFGSPSDEGRTLLDDLYGDPKVIKVLARFGVVVPRGMEPGGPIRVTRSAAPTDRARVRAVRGSWTAHSANEHAPRGGSGLGQERSVECRRGPTTEGARSSLDDKAPALLTLQAHAAVGRTPPHCKRRLWPLFPRGRSMSTGSLKVQVGVVDGYNGPPRGAWLGQGDATVGRRRNPTCPPPACGRGTSRLSTESSRQASVQPFNRHDRLFFTAGMWSDALGTWSRSCRRTLTPRRSTARLAGRVMGISQV